MADFTEAGYELAHALAQRAAHVPQSTGSQHEHQDRQYHDQMDWLK
jgi:hypothetical protein